jgi:divalent metal cation (Fe/Co/Zn/Cd) transporter
MLTEVIIRFLASSLALIPDEGHILSNADANALALLAMRLAAQPASGWHALGIQARRENQCPGQDVTLVVSAALSTSRTSVA